ncbi:MAG: iron-sulfur cluster insertion protein ErpA [Armatimonadetes bacterium]|nr:iron-sulfur cluster insertion protein ErpA [Armatimonadota bacterium]
MISVTERAAGKLREILVQQDDPELSLRLFITRGGCEGFSYGMAFDKERQLDDLLVEAHGVRVLVDPESLRVLRGAQIDYVQGAMGEGFAIRNPNAVATCGCGHSFTTKDDPGEAQPCDQEDETQAGARS